MYAFYADPPLENTLFQGDIIDNLVIPGFVSPSTIVRSNDGSTNSLEQILASQTVDSFEVSLRAKIQKGIIVSQTCDIQRADGERQIVFISPIINLEQHKTELLNAGKTLPEVENLLKTIRNQERGYYFYLPQHELFEEGYANLFVIVPIDKSLIETDKRILTLSPYSRHLLQYTLSNFFGRPFDQNRT